MKLEITEHPQCTHMCPKSARRRRGKWSRPSFLQDPIFVAYRTNKAYSVDDCAFRGLNLYGKENSEEQATLEKTKDTFSGHNTQSPEISNSCNNIALYLRKRQQRLAEPHFLCASEECSDQFSHWLFIIEIQSIANINRP